MPLLIDGYNLIFCAGIAGQGHGIGSLERSRLGALRFLAQSLDAAQRAATVIVFDAREAPPGLPKTSQYHGITVRFAARNQEADELLEELIQAETSPRQLTVVSSDHRVQRAARRRRARAVDSEVWHDELLRRQHSPPTPSDDVSSERDDKHVSVVNPFPPGYAEDLEG
jgi:predicted RNA-binding protein with PIN domain